MLLFVFVVSLNSRCIHIVCTHVIMCLVLAQLYCHSSKLLKFNIIVFFPFGNHVIVGVRCDYSLQISTVDKEGFCLFRCDLKRLK